MTPSETTTLARLARACCPQQHFDEYTPDVWHDLLGDLAFDDCREALVAAAKQKPFVSPAEIRAEVRRIRTNRLANADLALPPADPDARDYNTQLRALVTTIADGKTTPDLPRGEEPSHAPSEDLAPLLEDARRQCLTASSRLHSGHTRPINPSPDEGDTPGPDESAHSD